MKAKQPQISAVIPAYNEQPNLEPLVSELAAVLDALGRPYEMVLVDDASDDGSGAELTELAGRFPSLRVVTLVSRSGQTAALVAGFRAARGETIATLDADLQNNPADIPRMLPHLETHDLVCGIRRKRHDSWLRRLSSRIANGVRRAVIQDTITDIGCGLKLLRKRDLERLPLFHGMHRFLPALLQFEGLEVYELEVDHRARRSGVSKYNVSNRLFRAFADLLAVRWLKSRRIDYETKS